MRYIKNKYQSGQASVVLVLVLGLVAMMSVLASGSISVSNAQIEDTIYKSNKAWYAAWSGVDEMMYRLRSKQNFSISNSVTLSFPDGSTVSASITDVGAQKVVRSIGHADGVSKRLELTAELSNTKSEFGFAVLAGEGGFELLNNSYVTGVNNTPGNVYSNGNILGTSNSSGGSGSRILGSAWAVGYIGGLSSPTSGGVYVQANASASSMLACRVGGNASASLPPSNCPVTGTFSLAEGPPTASTVDFDVPYWKGLAEAGGTWLGNCFIGGGGPDCTGGTKKLGNVKIMGNLSISNNQNLTFTGPIWVVGDILISNNIVINIDNSVGTNSVVMIASDPANSLAKGKITIENNVDFNRNSFGAGIVVVSENTSEICSTPAIRVENNTDTAIFVGKEGCVYIGNNAVVIGVMGKKIHLENNSIIRNDPSLFSKKVLVGGEGWSVVNIREY